MGLIGIKIKDVKDFLKVNKSIKMPTILKNSKGEFVADGGYKDVYTWIGCFLNSYSAVRKVVVEEKRL